MFVVVSGALLLAAVVGGIRLLLVSEETTKEGLKNVGIALLIFLALLLIFVPILFLK